MLDWNVSMIQKELIFIAIVDDVYIMPRHVDSDITILITQNDAYLNLCHI